MDVNYNKMYDCNSYQINNFTIIHFTIIRKFVSFSRKRGTDERSQCLYRPDACDIVKKETLAQVFFCKFYEISKKTLFQRTPLVAASE